MQRNVYFYDFQLPTTFRARLNPNRMSVSRVIPLHITMLPGGGSDARFK